MKTKKLSRSDYKKQLITADLAESFVENGPTTCNILLHQRCFGRFPSLDEALGPSHLVTHFLSHGLLSPKRAPYLYERIAKKKEEDRNFYKKICPRWFYFSSQEGEKSLVNASLESIESYHKKNNRFKPLFWLDVWATSSNKYQRPENIPKEIYDKNHRKYVSCFELSHLEFEQANQPFKAIYNSLEERKKLQVHKNSENLHCNVTDLEEAVNAVLSRESIAKIDSNKVNVYLKKNHQYHLRIDILGNQPEIVASINKLQVVLAETYIAEKEVSADRVKFEQLKNDYPLVCHLPSSEEVYPKALHLNPYV